MSFTQAFDRDICRRIRRQSSLRARVHVGGRLLLRHCQPHLPRGPGIAVVEDTAPDLRAGSAEYHGWLCRSSGARFNHAPLNAVRMPGSSGIRGITELVRSGTRTGETDEPRRRGISRMGAASMVAPWAEGAPGGVDDSQLLGFARSTPGRRSPASGDTFARRRPRSMAGVGD